LELSFHASTTRPLHIDDSDRNSFLDEADWMARKNAHETRIDEWMVPHLERRSRNISDPVSDFIFEYYPFRPSHLRKWSPGLWVTLGGEKADQFVDTTGFVKTKKGVALDPEKFPRRMHRSSVWIRDFLISTRDRAPNFGCSGMHEWAMIYGSEPVRHTTTPLRMSRTAINIVVQNSALSCTHFDAFRFFTDAAAPLNKHQLERTTMTDYEQPACLHANMDLYRWAMKRSPWISSELIADTFFLAVDIRKIDMQASPYDLADWGMPSIPVETAAGKRDYQMHQRRIMEKASHLRQRLIREFDRLAEIGSDLD
jgi:hypothetical protein